MSTVQLEPGDLIFIYSDGVNEAKNMDGAQFGDDRIQQMPTPWPGASTAYLEEIFNKIKTFLGSAAASDDITMLAVRRLSEDNQD